MPTKANDCQRAKQFQSARRPKVNWVNYPELPIVNEYPILGRKCSLPKGSRRVQQVTAPIIFPGIEEKLFVNLAPQCCLPGICTYCLTINIIHYKQDDWRAVPSNCRKFSLCRHIQPAYVAHKTSYSMSIGGGGGPFHRRKAVRTLKLTTYLHLVSILRMHMVVSPPPYIFMSWLFVKHQGTTFTSWKYLKIQYGLLC